MTKAFMLAQSDAVKSGGILLMTTEAVVVSVSLCYTKHVFRDPLIKRRALGQS